MSITPVTYFHSDSLKQRFSDELAEAAQNGRLSPQEREAAGIRDSLIRVAVGLEDVADLKADLARGLAAL